MNFNKNRYQVHRILFKVTLQKLCSPLTNDLNFNILQLPTRQTLSDRVEVEPSANWNTPYMLHTHTYLRDAYLKSLSWVFIKAFSLCEIQNTVMHAYVHTLHAYGTYRTSIYPSIFMGLRSSTDLWFLFLLFFNL